MNDLTVNDLNRLHLFLGMKQVMEALKYFEVNPEGLTADDAHLLFEFVAILNDTININQGGVHDGVD